MTDTTPIRTAEELRELCTGLRAGTIPCDSAVISTIEHDVARYRLREPTQLPPEDLETLLPLMGWLIYEVTWKALQAIPNRFKQDGGEALERAMTNIDHIARAANAAREMPWPEYAPRALGAFRSQALAASKQDTEESYVEAQTLHLEARTRHAQMLSYHRKRSEDERDPYRRALDEMLAQLALAETGTACRTAERVIDRWVEDFGSDDAAEDQRRQDQQTQLVFSQLDSGADIGSQALEALTRVARVHGLKDTPDEEGLAQRSAFVNPGIMTARALLLLLAFSPEMERLGYYPMGEDHSWQRSRERLRERFEDAYACIERPIVESDGTRRQPRTDLQLAIVQIRLSAALLIPGCTLRSTMTFAPCLAHPMLDDAAIEALSAWLAEPVPDEEGRLRQRSRFRGIGAAIMPNFIAGVEACRAAFGGSPAYRDWRARWFILDKHADRPGRAEAVERVLGRPVSRQRPV